nr:nicotinamide-nucleotide amidohydrolase family protein [Microbacterium immunditiarum]
MLTAVAARGWSLAVAESLTGGLVLATLVSVPGASAVLRGGVVAYATDLKHSLLGVDADLLASSGAVHPEVARQMAEGVRVAAGRDGIPADVGIATTGVAGPDPQDGQAVGTAFIAVATPVETRVEALFLEGGRAEIRAATAGGALRLARECVDGSDAAAGASE